MKTEKRIGMGTHASPLISNDYLPNRYRSGRVSKYASTGRLFLYRNVTAYRPPSRTAKRLAVETEYCRRLSQTICQSFIEKAREEGNTNATPERGGVIRRFPARRMTEGSQPSPMHFPSQSLRDTPKLPCRLAGRAKGISARILRNSQFRTPNSEFHTKKHPGHA